MPGPRPPESAVERRRWYSLHWSLLVLVPPPSALFLSTLLRPCSNHRVHGVPVGDLWFSAAPRRALTACQHNRTLFPSSSIYPRIPEGWPWRGCAGPLRCRGLEWDSSPRPSDSSVHPVLPVSPLVACRRSARAPRRTWSRLLLALGLLRTLQLRASPPIPCVYWWSTPYVCGGQSRRISFRACVPTWAPRGHCSPRRGLPGSGARGPCNRAPMIHLSCVWKPSQLP